MGGGGTGALWEEGHGGWGVVRGICSSKGEVRRYCYCYNMQCAVASVP